MSRPAKLGRMAYIEGDQRRGESRATVERVRENRRQSATIRVESERGASKPPRSR